MAKIYEDNSFAIGNTPLVKLKSVTKNAKATVLAKIEGRNPAYSVKCRIGANMIWDAEKSGKLTKDKTIVEPTSARTTKIHGGLVHPEGRHERLRNRCILVQS